MFKAAKQESAKTIIRNLLNCNLLFLNLLKHHSFDELAPFSSDKIQAKILDLGYGGARRALHNLNPKSARILSAAITRTILLPAGVRVSHDDFHLVKVKLG